MKPKDSSFNIGGALLSKWLGKSSVIRKKGVSA